MPDLFDTNNKRTEKKQETHSLDATEVLTIRLKDALENLAKTLFGENCEMRWVDAYFPFTHPSFELEVLFNGQWLEVLGCGVMEQELLKNVGIGNKVGWAFGIGNFKFITFLKEFRFNFDLNKN